MALTRNEIKFIKSLQDKKSRETEKRFVVEGVKLFQELSGQNLFQIESIYCTVDFPVVDSLIPLKHTVSESELARISGLKNPNKVLAVVHIPEWHLSKLEDEHTVLVLDEIKDPGNLGTILRSADWFGLNYVLASDNSVDVFNPKVVQSSMGAIFRVKYIQGKVSDLLESLKKNDFVAVGADMEGNHVYQFSFPKKMALVLGSESHGILPSTKDQLDRRITIPKIGETESLNVGVAGSIILSHRMQSI